MNDLLQPYVFIDAAHGSQKSLVENDDDLTASLVGAGLGLRLNYQDKITANISLAFPVSEKYSLDTLELKGDGARLVFDMQYLFH